MSGLHVQSAHGGRTRIWLAGLGVALVAVLVALFVAPGGQADAAAPKPNYTPGKDTATFTVAGVLDHNCLVSTGGTELWIKPGDAIDFKSSLVGISVGDAVAGQTLGGLLNLVLQPDQVAGLNITAKIYTGTSAQTVAVAGGSTTAFPSSTQKALSAGDHKITWDATGLALIPSLLHAPIPLSSSALQSGAALSWSGVIHVTNSAPQCKLAVNTPKTSISVGPVHVSLPSVGITVPVTLPTSIPSIPKLLPTGSGTKSSSSATTAPAAPSYKYTPPAVSVPQQVVPQGDSGAVYGGNGGYQLGVVPTSGGNLTNIVPNASSTKVSSGGSTTSATPEQDSTGKNKTVDLASSSSSPSGQLPVLLAILAVIVLAMVAGIYARLYLLGRKAKG